ncbi:Synembryn-B [Homalodisca vitripennis]|nr:Synembryn-B [Homalodisca vitripennis]
MILVNVFFQHKQAFAFPELNLDDRRKKLWTLLFSHLDKPSSAICHKECLACVRILSREKTDLDDLCCEKWMNILLYHAGLVPQEQAMLMTNQPFDNFDVVLEAMKCLCNLVFNCEHARKLCGHNHAIEAIMMRLRTYRDPLLPHEIKFFDMRMLFVMTAFQPDIRPRLKEELHGLTYLMEILDLIIKDASEEEDRPQNSTPVLVDNQVQLASEVLKVLFNLTCKPGVPDEEEDAQLLRLESILKELLLCDTDPPSNKEQLQSHVVNLLTTMPGRCHQELMAPLTKDVSKEAEFEGYNMEAMAVLVTFLNTRLDQNPNIDGHIFINWNPVQRGFENTSSFKEFLHTVDWTFQQPTPQPFLKSSCWNIRGTCRKKIEKPDAGVGWFLSVKYSAVGRDIEVPGKSCLVVQSLQERLSPIVTVLLECAINHRLLRKYLRWRILPPLRDVHTRPEEGTTLRNKLCRLLTSPVTNVRDLVAELLFVLCKESVSRMIKYTGYGNAAGQFANRGLLAQHQSCQPHGQYSSDSDSETDEYSMYKHGINPVVGCYEPPRPDPTAHMTEEQKEYEAMQLVNMMDKLHRDQSSDLRELVWEHPVSSDDDVYSNIEINHNNNNNVNYDSDDSLTDFFSRGLDLLGPSNVSSNPNLCHSPNAAIPSRPTNNASDSTDVGPRWIYIFPPESEINTIFGQGFLYWPSKLST